LLIYAINAFSIPLLLRTLFSPWQMDKALGSKYDLLERVVFAIFSRFLGFVARAVLICIGLAFTLLVFLSLPLFLVLPIKISLESLQNLPSFGSSLSYGNTYYLNKHGRDVSTSGGLKIYGKEKALRMIERGLSKDTDHNVLLVGDTGVGKTTVINYLGHLGNSGLAYESILHHRVVRLEVESLSADEFEKCLKEATSAGNVILVIENIHAYTPLFELLMPYLAKPTLGIVVTTDFTNYDQTLKSYPEFLSKFVKVEISATTPEETLSVLSNRAVATRTKIDDDALVEIVRLAGRYVGNQSEPLRSLLIFEELRVLDKRVTIEDVRRIISDKTNMPIGAMSADERKVLIHLEDEMRKKIIGQDEAVDEVTDALKRLRAGVADPTKPAGSFLFLGPTGVGKTYTAKILAENYKQTSECHRGASALLGVL
jgi:ATP-dependent Clp protease ATP-binding subunit ClpA